MVRGATGREKVLRPMELVRLDHVQLAMPKGGEDLARRFYCDILGLDEAHKPENLARRGGCWFTRGDIHVHLGVQSDFRPATKAHPAFVVSNLAALRARLDDAGFRCLDDEPLDGFRRTYTSDPFGNRIELMEEIT